MNRSPGRSKLISTETGGRITLRPPLHRPRPPSRLQLAIMSRRRGHRLPTLAPPTPGPVPFVSADDFDATGVLVGFDPSASRYWWIPELLDAGGAEALVDEPLGEPLGAALGVASGDAHAADLVPRLPAAALPDLVQAAHRSRTTAPAAA